MRVVFLYGPPAAGKYTIGRLVADQLSLPLFHNHLCVDLVTSLFEFGSEGFISLREKIWIESFESAAKEGVSFVFTFNPETTVRAGMIEKLEESVRRLGGSIEFVELICESSDIEERLGNADRLQFGKLSDKGLYRELNEQGAFEYRMDVTPRLVIDTSRQSPEAAAEKIVSEFK